MTSHHFDLSLVVHELKHYLPSQTPIKDFIHHNSLHAFQHLKFYDAIFKGAKIFGFQPTFNLNEYRKLYAQGRIKRSILERVVVERKGAANKNTWLSKALETPSVASGPAKIGQLRAQWKAVIALDLDNQVQPLLFRILVSYLDQGIALDAFPLTDQGLLASIRTMETTSFTSFFKTKRAKKLLLDPLTTTDDLLKIVVGNERFYENYLIDQQFTHRGWSGMVATIEDNPGSNAVFKKISLADLIHFELLLEIDALDAQLGSKWQPLCQSLGLSFQAKPIDYFAPENQTEQEQILSLWQDAFEWSYYDEMLGSLKQLHLEKETNGAHFPKSFQAVFCIDERECSLRRHIESVDHQAETLGCPGFFGVEFFFKPIGGKFYEKLCPAPVTPKFLIKESGNHVKHGTELLYSKKSHTFFQGFALSLSLGVMAPFKLMHNLFQPKMSPAISDAFSHMLEDSELAVENTNKNDVENGLQVGFSLTEIADRVENLLRGIGLIKHFAEIVYLISHGSSSANNPHHGAHDCGACSGRPGATNARVFSIMANHTAVRAMLAERGLVIPDTTHFIGAMHDTASDEVRFYDIKPLDAARKAMHERNQEVFEKALDINAKERSRRFASIDTLQDIKKIRKAIKDRSVSLFEPRPELGHGTNALCFVGNRSLTKGLFLDRRAFLNSYDYRTDLDGTRLLGVIRPLPIVCGGINLEYYFSRMDNHKMGAGTKLPHHVMGLIGVANSSDGDLRPGLPLQMIEVHDPVRLLMVVEHYPEVVLKTIQKEESLNEWFVNEWVHLMAVHPETKAFYHYKEGQFLLYNPLLTKAKKSSNPIELIESAQGMATNHILDATKENLPIHILKNN
jgi:uncharacterized protein